MTSRSAPDRTPGLAGVRKLGFTCFRLIAVYDPHVAFAFRRVPETRAAMGAFVGSL